MNSRRAFGSRVEWWKSLPTPASTRSESRDDAAHHDGEIVTIDPFAEATFQPDAAIQTVRYLAHNALAQHDGARPWAVGKFSPREIDLRMAHAPRDTESRQALWKAMHAWSPNWRLNGVPFERPTPRTWREFPTRVLGLFAWAITQPVLAMALLTRSRVSHPHAFVAILVGAGCLLALEAVRELRKW